MYDVAATAADQRVNLWPSAVREAGWVRDLILLASADLRRPWDPVVVCADASEDFCLATSAEMPLGRVARLGRVHERWRYHDELELQSEPNPQEIALMANQDELVSQGTDLSLGVEFSSVVASDLTDLIHTELCSGAWERLEGIFILEG